MGRCWCWTSRSQRGVRSRQPAGRSHANHPQALAGGRQRLLVSYSSRRRRLYGLRRATWRVEWPWKRRDKRRGGSQWRHASVWFPSLVQRLSHHRDSRRLQKLVAVNIQVKGTGSPPHPLSDASVDVIMEMKSFADWVARGRGKSLILFSGGDFLVSIYRGETSPPLPAGTFSNPSSEIKLLLQAFPRVAEDRFRILIKVKWITRLFQIKKTGLPTATVPPTSVC